MAKALEPKNTHEHEVKWMTINRKLSLIGFWVKWEFSPYQLAHRYAIGKEWEKKPMGIYEDEATAQAMVKMILSNATEGD